MAAGQKRKRNWWSGTQSGRGNKRLGQWPWEWSERGREYELTEASRRGKRLKGRGSPRYMEDCGIKWHETRTNIATTVARVYRDARTTADMHPEQCRIACAIHCRIQGIAQNEIIIEHGWKTAEETIATWIHVCWIGCLWCIRNKRRSKRITREGEEKTRTMEMHRKARRARKARIYRRQIQKDLREWTKGANNRERKRRKRKEQDRDGTRKGGAGKSGTTRPVTPGSTEEELMREIGVPQYMWGMGAAGYGQ
eukprot:6181167-Pleurochrysis_carterae.AAC.4